MSIGRDVGAGARDSPDGSEHLPPVKWSLAVNLLCGHRKWCKFIQNCALLRSLGRTP